MPSVADVLTPLKRLAEAGTRGYAPDIKRRLMILNMFAYLVILTTVGFALQYGLTEGAQYRPLVVINLIIAAVVALVPLAHRINDIAGGLLIVITEFVALTTISAYLGRNGGTPLMFVIGAAAPFFVFGLARIGLALSVAVGGLVLHLYTWFAHPPELALIRADPRILNDYTQSASCDGIIDFTIPKATLALVALTAAQKKIHVIGTTGIDMAGDDVIREAAAKTCILKTGNYSLSVNLLSALVKKAAQALGEEIASLFALAGCEVALAGHYPGRRANARTPLLARCRAVFAREFGATHGESRVKVIHAGLECGIIGTNFPQVDMVSVGPDIRGAHAPGERVEVESVARCWHLLSAILGELTQ